RTFLRHCCEKRSDEAIQTITADTVWIASLPPSLSELRRTQAPRSSRSERRRVARNDGGGSPLLRRNIPQPRAMRGDVVQRIFQMHALVGRHVLGDADARPPFPRGADRPRHEAATAVRTDVVQLVLRAIRAERALIGADPRIERAWRQVLVAIFAVRPKLQRHDCFLS